MANTLSRRAVVASGGALLAGVGCETTGRASERFDVVVIGAGLAGLNCALNLQENGARVLVLEASERVGGRAYTARDLADRAEYGGIQVADTYARFQSRAAEFDLELGRFPYALPPPLYCIGDDRVTRSGWADAKSNPLEGDQRALTPDRYIGAAARTSNPFNELTDWSKTEFAGADISLADALQRAGFPAAAANLAAINANSNSLRSASIVNSWRSEVLFRSASRSEVLLDGTDALPSAMAAALAEPPRLNQRVREVGVSSSGYAVSTDSTRVLADQVVVTVPPAAGGQIRFNDTLASSIRSAWEQLPFIYVTLAFVDTPAFWETDGLPANMTTDGPFERWFPRIDARTGEQVGFKIWLNGAGALRADQTSLAALESAIRAELKRLRPASNGEARLAKLHSWQSYGNHQGAYPEWPAGQTAAVFNALQTPTRGVHIAGDYVSPIATGLEGAMESGELAASRVLMS